MVKEILMSIFEFESNLLNVVQFCHELGEPLPINKNCMEKLLLAA